MSFGQTHNQNEAILMLRELHENWTDSEEALDHLMKRYLLGCARAIWKLLPQEASRNGIEVSERYLLGLADDEEFSDAEYAAEGAAFNIDYNESPGEIKKWVLEIKGIPQEELSKIIHPIKAIKNYKPKKLLLYAAYFAHFVMVYPETISISEIITSEKIPEEYLIFLSPAVLREILLKR